VLKVRQVFKELEVRRGHKVPIVLREGQVLREHVDHKER
jgi:hypothetical protein